jgi:hypothetical protein
MFPWGGLCGGREEVLASGWTLDLLIERYNQDEKAVLTLDRELPPSKNWGGAVPYFSRLLNMIEKLGDRVALPFLEEKSLMTNAPGTLRSRAAVAYIKIADVGESVNLMRKLYDDRSFGDSQYYYVNIFFLQKVKSEEKSLTDEVKSDICTHLLAIVQNADNPRHALDAEFFLRDFLPGYTNSKQRATLVRYADTGNEHMTNNFNPIKAHFDAIPPKQRIDLRERFPDLPPLPDDAPARSSAKVAIAVAVGIVAVVAAWLALRRRKAHEAA